MIAIVSLIVCLSSAPTVCETVAPAIAHEDTGAPPTLFECLGLGGQDIARKWLAENPGYRLKRVQCSVASGGDERRLRERVESPRA